MSYRIFSEPLCGSLKRRIRRRPSSMWRDRKVFLWRIANRTYAEALSQAQLEQEMHDAWKESWATRRWESFNPLTDAPRPRSKTSRH